MQKLSQSSEKPLLDEKETLLDANNLISNNTEDEYKISLGRKFCIGKVLIEKLKDTVNRLYTIVLSLVCSLTNEFEP